MNEINFKRTVGFLGRNGYYQSRGIEMFGESILYISPITSRGHRGRCEIQIPRENIQELIDILNKYK